MKHILLNPHITEKTLALAARGLYTFAVSPQANKNQIAASVHEMYNVSVVAVRTISMHGKSRRIGKRATIRPAIGWKKAMVTVKKGETIDAFDIKTEEKPAK